MRSPGGGDQQLVFSGGGRQSLFAWLASDACAAAGSTAPVADLLASAVRDQRGLDQRILSITARAVRVQHGGDKGYVRGGLLLTVLGPSLTLPHLPRW
jgi:hypothetical protein